MTNTFLSGGGIAHDIPLADGTRIRLRPTGRAEQDIEVYVEDGVVHLVGHYTRLVTCSTAPNHVEVWPLVVSDAT